MKNYERKIQSRNARSDRFDLHNKKENLGARSEIKRLAKTLLHVEAKILRSKTRQHFLTLDSNPRCKNFN